MSIRQSSLNSRRFRCTIFFGSVALVLTVVALVLTLTSRKNHEFTSLSDMPWIYMVRPTSTALDHLGLSFAFDHFPRPISIIIAGALTAGVNFSLGAIFGLVIDIIAALELRFNKSNHAA